MILSVDSGRYYGWALWDRRVTGSAFLQDFGLCREVEKIPQNFRGVPFQALILETPHGGRGKASRANLVTLSRRTERVIWWLGGPSKIKVVEYQPSQWKQSVPQAIMAKRVYDDWLSADERAWFDQHSFGSTIAHNVLHAIGLGKYHCAAQGWCELRVK